VPTSELSLSDAELSAIGKSLQSPGLRPNCARRLWVILLLARGLSVRFIQTVTGTSPRYIIHWKRTWHEGGLGALTSTARRGRPRKKETEELEAAIREDGQARFVRPSYEALGQKFGVSRRTFFRVLLAAATQPLGIHEPHGGSKNFSRLIERTHQPDTRRRVRFDRSTLEDTYDRLNIIRDRIAAEAALHNGWQERFKLLDFADLRNLSCDLMNRGRSGIPQLVELWLGVPDHSVGLIDLGVVHVGACHELASKSCQWIVDHLDQSPCRHKELILANCLLALGHLNAEGYKIHTALGYLERCQADRSTYAELTPHRRCVLHMWRVLALALLRQDSKATKAFDEALRIANDSAMNASDALTLSESYVLGHVDFVAMANALARDELSLARAKFDLAEQNLHNAANEALKADPPWEPRAAYSYSSIANAHIMIGDWKEASYYLRRCGGSATYSIEPSFAASVHLSRAVLLSRTGDRCAAATHASHALELFRTSGLLPRVAAVNQLLASTNNGAQLPKDLFQFLI
jgi:transposase